MSAGASPHRGRLQPGRLDRALADDYTARYGADGEANVGRDHYVTVCRFLRKSFPDVNITIEDLVVEGEKIAMPSAGSASSGATSRPGPPEAGQPRFAAIQVPSSTASASACSVMPPTIAFSTRPPTSGTCTVSVPVARRRVFSPFASSCTS